MADQGGIFNNQFLQHALECSNPKCILPLCVNTKLKLQHSRGCKKINCSICQEMWSLASKHSESCQNYNCRIPFCMEAKLDMHKRAKVDLSDCLDALLKDKASAEVSQMERVAVKTTRPQRGPQSLHKSQDSESTPHLTASTPTSPSVLEFAMDMSTYSTVDLNAMVNHLAPFCKTFTPFENSPQPCLEQCRGQPGINVAPDGAISPWCGSMEPFRAFHNNALTREMTTPRSFVMESGKARENTATNQHITIGHSTSAQEQNIASRQINPNTLESKDQLNTACLPSCAEEASHNATFGVDTSFDGSVAGDSQANDSQTQLKARLIHALYNILRLAMQTNSTDELRICVTSLRSALYEAKKLKLGPNEDEN